MNLGLLLKIKNHFTDLGILLNEKELAAQAAAGAYSLENVNLNPLEELYLSIITATRAYETAVEMRAFGADIKIEEKEDTYGHIANSYANFAFEANNDLYSIRSGLVLPLITENEISKGRSGMTRQDKERLEKLLTINKPIATEEILFILDVAKKRRNSHVIQKVVYDIIRIKERLIVVFTRFKYEMLDDLGFIEAFKFLCSKYIQKPSTE